MTQKERRAIRLLRFFEQMRSGPSGANLKEHFNEVLLIAPK